MSQFLDYFTYENLEQGTHNRIFHHVTFLTPIGKYKTGETADDITISLEFFIWEEDEMTGDDVVYY